MCQSRHQSRLVQEPLDKRRVVLAQARRQNLDGDGALQIPLGTAIHRAHATAAQQFVDLVPWEQFLQFLWRGRNPGPVLVATRPQEQCPHGIGVFKGVGLALAHGFRN